MINVAIVGATGVVGEMFLKVLEEKKLNIDNYVLLASSRSKGKKIMFMGKEHIVEELTEHSFDNNRFQYALFSAGASTAEKYAKIAAQNGCIVIDNSSCFRMDKSVPLVVPQVNMEDAYEHFNIISNPNCSTIQAVVPLKVLDDKYKLKRVIYSTYQAVSGAGKKGIDDLENNTTNKFPYPIVNNCLPHIDVFLDNGYTKEEMKMIEETRKILKKPKLAITATCVRVPTLNCHCESITVELENDFKIEDIKTLLNNSSGIIVLDDPKREIYPINTFVNGTDEVYVGRIRRDFSVENGINFWCVADNIRKGAASNAVEILENLLNNK
ncbi:MAG: aspartate-semialdehyde dehydrogenase [Clostridia bacterium]|nr:aspartate-semialdehyde dehydrogenase [Clostridia bacterium]